jgi:hypothetical protein
MAKIQGIDMAFIKSISTVENTQRWEVTYEADFTAGSLSKDYRSNISEYTIAGSVGSANWTSWAGPALSAANNTNYTSTMAFNGSGMQIAPSTHADYDSTNYWDTWTNSPRIVAALDELVPGPSGVPKMVCIQLHAEASRTFATDAEFFGLCMGLQSERDMDNMFALAHAQYNGGLLARAARGDAGTTAAVGTMPTYFEIIIYPGANQTRIAVGTWDGEFPTPGKAHTLSVYQSNYEACSNMTSANIYIGMTATTNYHDGGSATAFTATAKKIRVSTLAAIPNATEGVASCV